MLVDDVLDPIFPLWDQNIAILVLSPLGKVEDLSLKRVNSQSLGGGDLQNSLDMNDYLVKIRIVFLKLFKRLLFVNLKDLLLDSEPLSFIFSPLFDHVVVDHVFERRLGLQSPDLGEPSDANIFEGILKSPTFSLLIKGYIVFDQMFWHVHDVIQRIWLVFQ